MLAATLPLIIAGFAAVSINKPISKEAASEPESRPPAHYRPDEMERLESAMTQIALTDASNVPPKTVILPISSGSRTNVHPTIESLRRISDSTQGAEQRAATDAMTFFNALPGGVPRPHALQTDRGVVMLVWNRGDIYAEVEFEGNARCYVYCRDLREERGDGAEDVPITVELHDLASGVLAPLAPHVLGAKFALAA